MVRGKIEVKSGLKAPQKIKNVHLKNMNNKIRSYLKK
jgi:hypothetical protein